MNILFIYDAPLRPENGGTERATQLVMNELVRRGHQAIGILHWNQTDPAKVFLNGVLVDSISAFLKENHLLFQEIPSCNDWSFAFASLACATKISVIREPLMYYRTQTNTSISSYRYKRTKDIVRAIQQLKVELKSRDLYSQYQEGFARKSVNHLVYEAFAGRRWSGIYVLARNLLIVNDWAIYKAFVFKVIRYFGKRLRKGLKN